MAVYSTQEELQHALREIFPSIKELQILRMMLSPILKKDFISIRLEWYYIKLKKSLFSVFSKGSFKPGRSKLEETEKRTHQTMQIFFWFFGTMLHDLYHIIVHLNTLTHPLRKLLQKDVDFDWTKTSNKAFEKL